MSGCTPPVGGSPLPAVSPAPPAAPRSLRSAALAAVGSIQSGIVCCSAWLSTLPKLVRVNHRPSLPCLIACNRVLPTELCLTV
eukprot:1185864-Prorocentrum_minimum.AAC.1